MRLRTLLTTAVVGTLIAGTAGMTAQATPVPSLATAGTVVTWGDTANAQAAAAMAVPPDLTAPVPAAPVVAMASSPRAAAAVTADGHLRVWGTGSEVDQAPTNVTDAVAVALAQSGGLVLHRDGTVTGWGNTAVAEDVPAGLRARAISVAQGGTAYAVTTDGTVVTWGAGPMPAPAGLTNVVDVAAGSFHVVALKADGTVVAWHFVTGDPATDESFEPLTAVPDFGTRKVTKIDANNNGSGVILDDGSIAVWGLVVPTGQPRFGSSKVVSLDVGDSNAGAVTEDGAVYTWGSNVPINTRPASLAGEPAASVVLGNAYAAVVVTNFRELAAPSIVGTPQVGQTLRATPATLSLTPDTPVTGQWYADAAPIAGETGTRVTLDQTMLNKNISYRSTATRRGHEVTSTSNEVGPVATAPSGDAGPAAKASSTVTAKAKATGKTKKIAKKVTITVTVKTTAGVSPAGKVIVTVKGSKKVTAKVNAKGKATVTLKKVKRGKHKATITYTGNTNVASAKTTTTVRV